MTDKYDQDEQLEELEKTGGEESDKKAGSKGDSDKSGEYEDV